MEDLVKFMARNLVEEPDAVRVSSRRIRDGMVIQLQVAPEDTGRVIGKNGRVANAMRSVLQAAALRRRQHVILRIR